MRAILAALLLLSSLPAVAETCGDYAATIANLSATHGERRTAQAITATDGEPEVIELWESRDGRTWTLLRVRGDGTVCMVADGARWTPALHRYSGGRPL